MAEYINKKQQTEDITDMYLKGYSKEIIAEVWGVDLELVEEVISNINKEK